MPGGGGPWNIWRNGKLFKSFQNKVYLFSSIISESTGKICQPPYVKGYHEIKYF